MSRRCAKRSGTARVALVGPSTADGAQLKELLASTGVPGSRVDLYGTTGGEAVISDYAGEARLIQEPRIAEIVEHDLIFLCEAGDLARDVVSAARPGTLLIDLAAVLPETAAPVLVHMNVNREAAHAHRGFVAVPHPLAVTLADLLHPLDRTLGVEEVVALVFRPASDFGEQGIDELREQTVRLLNFAQLPTKTFGRQLAFNLIPQDRLSCETPSPEERVVRHVSTLMGWEQSRMTLKLFAVPLFYGHGVLLRLRTRTDTTADRLGEVLASSAALDSGPDTATPLDASGDDRVVLSRVSEDGLGGFWVWVVAGEIGRKSAQQAVRLAAELSDL